MGPLNKLVRKYSYLNWAVADQVIISAANFANAVLLARGLGLTEFGRFSLVWMAILFGLTIQHAAISSPMMSIGPKQRDSAQPSYFGGMFLLQGIYSISSATVVLGGVLLFSAISDASQLQKIALPLAVATIFCQCQDFLRRYFYTISTPAASVASDATRYLTQLAVFIYLVFSHTSFSVSATLWIMAAAAAAGCVAATPFIHNIRIEIGNIAATAKRNLDMAKWLTGTAIIQWPSGNLGLIAVAALVGPASVGALKVAQNLMGVLHVLFQSMENIVAVRAAQYHSAEGTPSLVRYLKKVSILGGILTASTILLFSATPTFWLSLLYGDQYTEYSHLVRLYGILYFVLFLNIPIRYSLLSIEKTQSFFSANLYAFAASLLLTYPFVIWFHEAGVVVVMIFVQLIIQVSLIISFRKWRAQ